MPDFNGLKSLTCLLKNIVETPQQLKRIFIELSRAFYFVQLIETFPLFNVNFNILGQNFSNQIEIGLQISIQNTKIT